LRSLCLWGVTRAYTHTHTHTHTHARTHKHTHTNTRKRAHNTTQTACERARTLMCPQTHSLTHIHTQTRTHRQDKHRECNGPMERFSVPSGKLGYEPRAHNFAVLFNFQYSRSRCCFWITGFITLSLIWQPHTNTHSQIHTQTIHAYIYIYIFP
jgi:hypothetical protein